MDITDTNEFAPRSDREFPFDLPEDTPTGTVIGVIDGVVDPDTPDGPLIYRISEIQPSGRYLLNLLEYFLYLQNFFIC